MQDRVDATTIYPDYQPPPIHAKDVIRHDRPGGDTNDSGGGPAVPNDFNTLPNDAEGSDQEQDMTYDQDTTYDRDPDTADGGALEDSGLHHTITHRPCTLILEYSNMVLLEIPRNRIFLSIQSHTDPAP
jgi:hypothetical protein